MSYSVSIINKREIFKKFNLGGSYTFYSTMRMFSPTLKKLMEDWGINGEGDMPVNEKGICQ